jgi:Putative prokaryotic signal transducing protein
MKEKRGPDFVEVRAFDNYIYAHIVLAKLQDSGINCHLKDEYTITIDPLLSPALGGIKLMVAQSQVERALEILAEPEG